MSPRILWKNCQIPKTEVLCPTKEDNYMEINERCFYIEQQLLDLEMAKANCAKNTTFSTGGGKLFEPLTLEENNLVAKMTENLTSLIGIDIGINYQPKLERFYTYASSAQCGK